MDAGHLALCSDAASYCSVAPPIFESDQPPTTTTTTIADANLDSWVGGKRFHTECGTELMKYLLARPCGKNEISVIKTRQNIIASRDLHLHRLLKLLEEAKSLEKDALWVLTKPDLKKTWPLPFLFPTMFGLKYLNEVPLFHEAYHFCRLIVSPAMTIFYPIGLIFGPWIYLRMKMGWNLSFKAYIMFAFNMIRALKGTAALKIWVTLGIYAGLYFYSVAQVVDLARMVNQARTTLATRHKNVLRLLEISKSVQSICGGPAGMEAFGVDAAEAAAAAPSANFIGVWKWWGDSAAVDQRIRTALQTIAVGDVVAAGARLLQKRAGGVGGSGAWNVVEWAASGEQWPRFYGMRHPVLGMACVANPAALDKNIILTGPNAAGKTTYCRGLLANILLGQTLGIVCARKATMSVPFDGIISFMRINDETGSTSLFEAEVERCVEMWKVAEESQGRVFMVLDEPMHATPPTEGAAAAMAFMKGLAKMGTVRVVATTHYAPITSLAFEEPADFINISMEAILRRGKKIEFPYKLRSGPSFQSIALELMQEQGAFPNAFIEDALRIKEKIGGREIVAGV